MRKTTSVNYRNEAELIANCPLAAAMKLIGGRWKIMLLWYLHHGIGRFSDLKGVIPHIADKMLWQQLREMERDMMVQRRADGGSVDYSLTALGESLVPLLAGLAQWATQHDVVQRVQASMVGEATAADCSGTACVRDRLSTKDQVG
jgi:DNA-binding HxlR family transcriptional regulator